MKCNVYHLSLSLAENGYGTTSSHFLSDLLLKDKLTMSAAGSAAVPILCHRPATSTTIQILSLPSKSTFTTTTISKPISTKSLRPITEIHVSSPTNKPTASAATSGSEPTQETIFFDGGAHYGDLLANLLLGFTLLWLPLTLAAVSRAFFLRYRFTNLRVTVISGWTGQDRSDFSYQVIKDVKVVPRFIGEWGDIVITLKDGTKVDLRSVPKFREIAEYCLSMAEKPLQLKESRPKGF
ncbi:hypothetical protein Nepgr_032999 [Nepenthes gracilis]|uniref:YdbS-like PH domain-containing protein n=1 Tax=Nepenthes gracilis TaxID=150966 RepID=A0AAD3Y8Q6_NEPGR|nr:hypothetical protein Nepgr_032999 [Nepenthes gracilis]